MFSISHGQKHTLPISWFFKLFKWYSKLLCQYVPFITSWISSLSCISCEWRMYKGLSASSRIWASITHLKYSSKFGGTICVDECHSGILEICFTFLVFSVFPAPDSPVTRMDWFFPEKIISYSNHNDCKIMMAVEDFFKFRFLFFNLASC